MVLLGHFNNSFLYFFSVHCPEFEEFIEFTARISDWPEAQRSAEQLPIKLLRIPR